MDENYWTERSTQRLTDSEVLGNRAIEQILPIYQESLRNINKQIQSIFDNYAKKGIVDVELLKKALTPAERRAFLIAIEENAEILGIDLSEIYDERYLARLTRFEAIKQQIQLEIAAIAPEEVDISTKFYTQIIATTYKGIQSDFKLMGVEPNFTTIDKTIVNAILRSKFYGKNFSERIWSNVDEFSKELPTILGGALNSGTSYEKTARLLRQRFDVSKYEATRLIRTETNYFHNQSELQSYIDDNYDTYQYDATRDSRTTQICRDLDAEVFKVADAKPGVNYPPMHPNCRSQTKIVFDIRSLPKQKSMLTKFDKAVQRASEEIEEEGLSPAKLLGSTGKLGTLNAELNYLSNPGVAKVLKEHGFQFDKEQRAQLAREVLAKLGKKATKTQKNILEAAIKGDEGLTMDEISSLFTKPTKDDRIDRLRVGPTNNQVTQDYIDQLQESLQKAAG